MKKFVLIMAVVALGVYLAGCGKKESDLSALQEPTSMEALTAQASAIPAATAEVKPVSPVVTTSEVKLEQLPPSGPFKPSASDIQTALKNAGYYTGSVDGKVGPKTKRAIEEFQKANSLTADGKVGPKTWEVLGKYLASAVSVQQ
ncbi:MAG: peptidoglycan-binding domain-containing protein [Candidatus Omnitrophota bacterium]